MKKLIITNNYGIPWTAEEKESESNNKLLWKEIRELNKNNKWGDKIGEYDVILIGRDSFVVFYNKIGFTQTVDTGEKLKTLIEKIEGNE